VAESVGRGASADVLEWQPGTVLKLFRPEYAYAVDMELERARAVHALGAPCPAVLGVVEHEGRRGIEFERIDGPLLVDSLRAGASAAAGVAARLAELHLALHALRVPDSSPLPRLGDWLLRYLDRLPERERAPARAAWAGLPRDTGLCHMDLHPGNVIVRGAELVVVDWVNACSGPLALDAARSIVLMAYQDAVKRDGARQATRLALAERYREAMCAVAPLAELDLALAFASHALLAQQPHNPFAAELAAAIPWRA
jgi:aminoglycoside phosphotransferase (APT) family kinase protein